jgi:hypothetical protein
MSATVAMFDSAYRSGLRSPMQPARPFVGGRRLGDLMHFLILIGGAVLAVAVWYFRFRGPAAVGDVVDAAGNLKGAYNRRKFRKKAEGSTLSAIDDPALGAAVYLVSLAEAGAGLGPKEEEAIAAWLKDVAGYGDPVEALTFAKWAAREVVDVNEVLRRLTPLWRERLDTKRRQELVAAAISISAIRGPDVAQAEALRRLRERIFN